MVAAQDFKGRAADQGGMTGGLLVEAMQQARKLGLRLQPARYHPAYRAPPAFEDDDR